MFARELPGVSLGFTTSRLCTSAIFTDEGGQLLVQFEYFGNTLRLVDNPNDSTVNCQEVPL